MGVGIRLAPNPSAECEKAEHPHLTRGRVCVWKEEEEPPLSPSGPPPTIPPSSLLPGRTCL